LNLAGLSKLCARKLPTLPRQSSPCVRWMLKSPPVAVLGDKNPD